MPIRNKPLGILVTKLTEQINGDPAMLALDFRSVGRSLIHLADLSAVDLLVTLDTLDTEQVEILAQATDPLIVDAVVIAPAKGAVQ